MKSSSLFLSLGFLLIFAMPAYAYLDPGAGSMMLQALIGALLAVVTTIGVYWRRLKGFLGRFTRRRENR